MPLPEVPQRYEAHPGGDGAGPGARHHGQPEERHRPVDHAHLGQRQPPRRWDARGAPTACQSPHHQRGGRQRDQRHEHHTVERVEAAVPPPGHALRSGHHERPPHDERGTRHAEDRQAEEHAPARAAGRCRQGCVVVHGPIGDEGPLRWRMRFSIRPRYTRMAPVRPRWRRSVGRAVYQVSTSAWVRSARACPRWAGWPREAMARRSPAKVRPVGLGRCASRASGPRCGASPVRAPR